MQAFAGRMIITEDRFTYSKAPKWTMAFGLIGALLSSSAKGKILVDDEISNLKFSKGRVLGKRAYLLTVTTQDGNSYDFMFDDKLYDKVKNVIKMEELVEA